MHKTFHFPQMHVSQRGDMPQAKTWLFRLLAIVGALLMGALFLLCLGYNPLYVYGTLIEGALGTVSMQKETIKIAIPLCITALGITLAFKMKFWNIGAEGQIAMGAIAASYFAYFHGTWPSYLLIPVMMLVSVVVGGLFGLIPAIFKVKFGTNETLFTLMLNYIALYIIQFLREGPWRDPAGGFAAMPRFPKSARLPFANFPFIGNIHMGWIVALVLVVLVFVYLRFTKQGYELNVVGENMRTAQYSGMPVNKIILRTMFLSAGICGLAGMVQVAGVDKQLTETVAGGRGFTAISVAWLARLSPFGILVVAFMFSVLEKGCSKIETVYRIPASMSDILTGIILFFVLGAEFFIQYKIAFRKEEKL